MTIHLHTSQRDSLLREICASLEELGMRRKRRHELRILTCYLDAGVKGVKKLISTTADVVRLTDVELIFEALEAYRGRMPYELQAELEKLRGWCARRNIALRWIPVRVGALMHAKAYCVVQRVGDAPRAGVVWITSGNATHQGLGVARGRRINVELSSRSTLRRDVASFLRHWTNLAEYAHGISEPALPKDAYALNYALLASGVFLHDWRETLRSRFGLRYRLTKEARATIRGSTELADYGLNLDQDTATRNPFSDLETFPTARSLPGGFTRRYTVDTLLGRWCPRSVWQQVEAMIEREAAFEAFRKDFFAATEGQMLEAIKNRELQIEAALIEAGYTKADENRFRRWERTIEWFRENETRLSRFFIRFEPFDLPYDYQGRDEVERLFESMLDSLETSRQRSWVSTKILDVQESGDLSCLELTKTEHDQLLKTLRDEDASEDG